jgi:DNA-directed RNA polymerase specialized sigma24 family protein
VAVDEIEDRFQKAIELADGSAHLEILRNPALEWRPSEAERALQRLPEEFRVAVLLVDVQDLSYEEAASVMKCPVGNLAIALVPRSQAARGGSAGLRAQPGLRERVRRRPYAKL